MSTTETEATTPAPAASQKRPRLAFVPTDPFADDDRDIPEGGEAYTPREELINRLTTLSHQLEDVEGELLHASILLVEAEEALAERRAALLLDPAAITGRNEQQRDAQLFDLTRDQRRAVTSTAIRRDRARVQFNAVRREFAAMRACARLLAREPD